MKKTVAIVGMSPNWADFLDEPDGVEIWGLNQGHAMFSADVMARFSAWFQIHSWEGMAARQDPRHHHLEFLEATKLPVYLHDLRPAEVPNGIRYPYEDVSKELGGTYFACNSFTYMIALAICQGYEAIHLHGVNFDAVSDKGDSYARPAVEFYLGLARGQGIEVHVPETSALFKADLYGRSINDPLEMMLDALRDHIERLPYGQARLDLIEVSTVGEAIWANKITGGARQNA